MRTFGNIQARPTPVLYIRPPQGDPFFHTPAEVSAALVSGEYKLVVVDGGTVGPDAATLTAGLISGAYTLVIVPATAPANAGTLSATLSSGSYALA